MKAINLKHLPLTGLSSVADDLVIASGRSVRHVSAMAEKLMEAIKRLGTIPCGTSGVKEGEWALIDFGDVVVHIMTSDTRAFYDLEGLWEVPAPHTGQA